MRGELQPILRAIDEGQLPAEAATLFHGLLDKSGLSFAIQETFVLDFKETRPLKFTDDYGASIVRLALAFHNMYGGLIVFGVRDEDFQVVGIDAVFDIEAFNAVLGERTGQRIECVTRAYDFDGKRLEVLLVPRRGATPPVRLIQDLGKYKKGALWVRDRHEALEARAEHLPLLFSGRLFSTDADAGRLLVHRSLPPSPATIKSYLERLDLEAQLWLWCVHSDQPRFYLHGRGGSGKSTLAFEFAKSLADVGTSIRFPDGEPLDYVLYLSAKETEFNPHVGQQQKFELRNFSSAEEQTVQILYHSGFLGEAELEGRAPQELDRRLDELVNNFNGLIVLDDIDALSRRGVDTGEEKLFLKAARARKRLRILYPLRYVPPYALVSAAQVPGLADVEFDEFVSRCCHQFDTPIPTPDVLGKLKTVSDGLPLIVETIIGLCKTCGSYPEALKVYDQKGGDEARKYLYQREYERLDGRGAARLVLAALALLNVPVSYRVLCNIVPRPEEEVRDAMTEISRIFVNSVTTEAGETAYQISPTSYRFVLNVSRKISYFDAVKRAVDLFSDEAANLSPEEAAILQNMERSVRLKKWEAVVSLAEGLELDHPVRVNPRFQSALGQGYASLGDRVQARECFKRAYAWNHRDVFMMRAWYHLERSPGYALHDAKEVCEMVIKDQRFGPKAQAEFYAKLGGCRLSEGWQLQAVDKRRAALVMREALADHLEGLWVGRRGGINRPLHMQWFEQAAVAFLRTMGTDIELLFAFLESLPEAKHDVDLEAVTLLIRPLRQIQHMSDTALRARVIGLCSRSVGKLNKVVQKDNTLVGFQAAVEELDAVRRELEHRGGTPRGRGRI